MELKLVPRPRAISPYRTAHGAQHDPGIYELLQPDATGLEAEVGWLVVQSSGYESWLVAQGGGLPPNVRDFVPAGSASPGIDHYSYKDRPQPVSVVIPSIHYSFHQIDCAVTVEPAHGMMTAAGGVAPATPFLYQEGQYKIMQAGLQVGDLFVASTSRTHRTQHWFLYTGGARGKGIYTWPGSVNTNVTTQHQLVGPYAAFNIDQFRRTLPLNTYLVGEEDYIQTYT